MIFLKVPFNEKDAAKTAGAKWHSETKQWYVDDDADLEKFQQWSLNKPAFEMKPLTFEVMPSTCKITNLRNYVSQDQWQFLQTETFNKAGHHCEICGGVGKIHPVECHEIWHFDDENAIQRLEGLVALCPNCHEAKHYPLMQARGKAFQTRLWLGKINQWTQPKVDDYIKEAFAIATKRGEHYWRTDLNWVKTTYGIEPRTVLI